ncbi:hypothetical protein Tco_0017076 [Tanacetum coccineum]
MNMTSRESVSKTDERIDKLADQLSTLVEIVSKKVVTPAPVKAIEETCVTCGGTHSWYNCPNTDNNQASVCAATGSYNQVNPPNRVSNQMAPPSFAPVQNNGQNRFNQNQGQGNNFNRGNNFHANPSPKKVVERETEETTVKEQTNFQGCTAQIPPPVTPISIPKPDVPKSLPKPNIPYPSRRDDQKSREKASNQMEKIFQIFQDLRFDISFADALLLMPRFAPTIKSLLMNKEKLLELAKIPLNENCSAMLLKKLPKKLGDPGKFLIPCNFLGMDVCHALVSILARAVNLYSLYLWKKSSQPELTPNSEDFRVMRIDPKPILQDSRRLCEEYAPELLGFSNSSGGNPTLTSDPFTSEFILKKSKLISRRIRFQRKIDYTPIGDHGEDICFDRKMLNNDPFSQLSCRWTLNKVKYRQKSSIEVPPEN